MIVSGEMGSGLHVEGPVIEVKGHIVNFASSCQPAFTAGVSGGNHCHAYRCYNLKNGNIYQKQDYKNIQYLTWIFIHCGRQSVNFNLFQLMCGSLCCSQSATALSPPNVQYSIWLVCKWQKPKK